MYEEITIYINDGNQTSYKCKISIEINLTKGMKFDVLHISCEKALNSDLAVNSEVGIYKFTFQENDLDIQCQFVGFYKNETDIILKTSIQDSIKCESYCITVGGKDPNKACKFPFVWKGARYGACTDVDHPAGPNATDLFCATEINEENEEMKTGKWGKCSRTCGYCSGYKLSRKKNRAGKFS